MFVLTTSRIDRIIGMLIYGRPDIYVDCVKLRISPSTFKVFEVGVDGVAAAPRPGAGSDEVYSCRDTEFLRYILCKEGVTTREAVESIRKLLGLSIGYAGLKDANAFTCQYITVKCRPGRRLRKVLSLLQGAVTIYFKDIIAEPIDRGCLLANKFDVVITITERSSECIEKLLKALQSARELSIPNFYGYQRFGSRRPVNHLIGKALLSGDYEEAVNLLVGKHELSFESGNVRHARKLFDEGRVRESLRAFPRKFKIERKVLKKLVEGSSYRDAMISIGAWYIKFFIEAYQSYLFNLSLSTAVIQEGGVDALLSKCEVLPLPYRGISGEDPCVEYVKHMLSKEGVKDLISHSELSKYLRRGAREVSFRVANLRWLIKDRSAILEFELPSSTYATVFLRELLRDGLIL